MEKSDNNSKTSNLSDSSENESNIQAVAIPTDKPILRKGIFFSETKRNKRFEKKPKTNQQLANNKMNNLRNQNKNPEKVSNISKVYSNNNSKMGSSKSNKTKNSKLNSLNSSFSSVENLYNGKNYLNKKTSPFMNNYTNINVHNEITNNNNNSAKRSNLKYATNENNKSSKQTNAMSFNNNIKKTLIVEKENTKKFTQQVLSKLNKDTGSLAQKLKNEQKGIKADPDLKRSFLKEHLFRNIYNLEVDSCQNHINQMMMDFTEISHELINVKAECESEVEFFHMEKVNCKEEIEELEEELRKLETEKALLFEEDREFLDKLEEIKKKENELIEMEKKIDYDLFSLEQMTLSTEEHALAQLEIEKNKDAHLLQFYEELTDIRKNMTILKPFFKKFIVIRGLEKRNFSKLKETNNVIKINEEENSLKILLPKSAQSSSSNEINNSSNLNTSNSNAGQETLKQNDCVFENQFLFYDEIFTLYENKYMLLDKIIYDNNQDAVLNRDVSGIFSAHFNKTLAYSEKDKKDYFCLYISDPIKITQTNEIGHASSNSLNKRSDISFNKNFIIALEKQIKQFSPLSAFDVNCFLIAKDDLIPYSSFKNIEIKDIKKFDLNIIKYDKNHALSNQEKKNSLDLFKLKKNEAKKILINENELELSNYNSQNYFYSENFINFLSRHPNRGVYGFYFKITCAKNNSELKFFYSDVNQTATNNEIIKKLSEISNKNFKKIKTIKKAELLTNEDNKLFNLISEKIGFNNVKHSSCFLDLSYHLDLGFDGNIVSSFVVNNNANSFNNCDKEYDKLAYEGKSEAKSKLICDDLSKKKGSDNLNLNHKNPLSRSNSFNKGSSSSFTNNNQNNFNNNSKILIGDNSINRRKDSGMALKEDRSVGKINSNNKSNNASNKISPNNLRNNSNVNLNNINNNRGLNNNSNNINNKSRDNSKNNKNDKRNLSSNNHNNNEVSLKKKENLKGKINDNDTKNDKSNLYNNIKTFDKHFLFVNSDNEISLKTINENESKLRDLMDIEVISIKDADADAGAKNRNEASVFYNNLDSFGKTNKDNNNNIKIEKKSNEAPDNQMLVAEKFDFNFNFDYRKFDEITKYFKEK